MKNWLLPITVLSVSGLGLLFASERGRKRLHTLFEDINNADPLGQFNQALEDQLENIQHTLERLSKALEGEAAAR